MHQLCPASLLNKIEQASQAELVRRGAWSYLIKNCLKYRKFYIIGRPLIEAALDYEPHLVLLDLK